MAMNMDAALRITTRVDGANGIVSLNRNLQAVGSTAKGVTGALVGLTGASAGLSGALGALAPLASIAGLVGLAKGSLDAGDKMFDLAQKTGVSVEALARFKKAASTSGTDIDAVSKALVKLSKGMVEAAATGKGKAADSLKALGLSAVDASGKLKGADQVTLEIANRFKSMADGPAKAALALNLFGKAGADMIPLLNMGGDAIDKLSVKMTTAFAQKADAYSDKLALLSGKVGAFGADLLIALLPALNAVTDAVSGAVSAFNSLPPLLKNVAVGGALIAVAWGPLAGLVKGTTAAFIVCQGAIQGFQLQMKLAAMEGIPLLNAAIMSIPLAGWAIAAVAALAALGAALYLNNKDFKQWADTSLNFIKVLASDGIGTMRSFGAWLGQMWNGLVKGAQKVGASIGQAFSGPFGVIGQVAQSVFDFVGQKIQGIWNMLPEGLRKSIGSVGSYFQGAWSKAAGMTATGGQGAAAGAATSADGFTPDMAALAGAGGGKDKKPKTTQEILGLSDAEMAAAVTTALGEFGGSDPRGRADVFANILSRREEGKWGNNLINVVTAPGQYAPNFGRSPYQVADPAFGKRNYGASAWNSAMAELQNPAMVAQSVKDIDGRLYFKGTSQYRFKQSADYLRASGQNFFHDKGAYDAGRPKRVQSLLSRLAGAGNAVDEIKKADEAAAALTATKEQIALDVVAAGYQKEYVLVEQQINNLGLRQNEANAAGNSILSLQIDKSKEILANALAGTKAADETNRKLQDSIANKETFNKEARDSLIYAEYEAKSAERAEASRARILEIDQKLAQERKRQAGEQANALREISDRSRYKVIGDLRGSEALQRQQELDGMQRKIGNARGAGRVEEAQRLEEQLKLLQNEYKNLDTLANSASYGVAKGIRGYLEDIGSLADSVSGATKSIIQSLEENLSTFFETGKFNFKDFASYAIKQLQRVVLQQLIMKPLINALGGLLGGAGGGAGGGAVGRLFNPPVAAKGMVLAANGIQPFANGGIIDKPTVFPFAKGIGLMGEAGPEAIMPLRRGRDGRLGVAGGGGGDTTINVSVDAKGTNIQGDGTQGNALARVISQAVQNEMVKQRRPGGILAS